MSVEELKGALVALQKAISEANSEIVKSSLVEIERIRVDERKELHAQLKHYLKNRSYQKALMFLNGEADIPAGRCGGGKSSPKS